MTESETREERVQKAIKCEVGGVGGIHIFTKTTGLCPLGARFRWSVRVGMHEHEETGAFLFPSLITAPLFACTRNAPYLACWSVSGYMGQGPGCLAIKMLSMGGVGIECWTVHRQLGLLLLAMVFQTTPWPLNLALLVAKPASQPRASTFSPRSPSSAMAGSYAQRGGPR